MTPDEAAELRAEFERLLTTDTARHVQSAADRTNRALFLPLAGNATQWGGRAVFNETTLAHVLDKFDAAARAVGVTR